MIRERRRKYIIKPAFQLRYAGVILFTVFAVCAVCILTTYHLSMSLLGQKLANVYPQGRLIVTLRNINSIIILRFFFLIPVITLFAVILSHKIAGPAYRIEKTLGEIGKGNFDIRIHLRKYDELNGIAQAVNEMAADLKALVRK